MLSRLNPWFFWTQGANTEDYEMKAQYFKLVWQYTRLGGRAKLNEIL